LFQNLVAATPASCAYAERSGAHTMRQPIIHIALLVRDYDEAIAFYTEQLGFTLLEDTAQPE
jgi:predicted enzyme related to lactoylglutathione lyase